MWHGPVSASGTAPNELTAGLAGGGCTHVNTAAQGQLHQASPPGARTRVTRCSPAYQNMPSMPTMLRCAAPRRAGGGGLELARRADRAAAGVCMDGAGAVPVWHLQRGKAWGAVLRNGTARVMVPVKWYCTQVVVLVPVLVLLVMVPWDPHPPHTPPRTHYHTSLLPPRS